MTNSEKQLLDVLSYLLYSQVKHQNVLGEFTGRLHAISAILDELLTAWFIVQWDGKAGICRSIK